MNRFLAYAILGAFLSGGCTAITEKSPGEAVTDAAIITKAKAAFAVDPIVKARNIHVTAVKGDVTLSGIVKSLDEALRATELVSALPGVTHVASVLTVEP
jgi:osmotically-inducible protein OsmY